MKALSKAKLRHSQKQQQDGKAVPPTPPSRKTNHSQSSNHDDISLNDHIPINPHSSSSSTLHHQLEYERNLLLLTLLNMNLNLIIHTSGNHTNDDTSLSLHSYLQSLQSNSEDVNLVNSLSRINNVPSLVQRILTKQSIDLSEFELILPENDHPIHTDHSTEKSNTSIIMTTMNLTQPLPMTSSSPTFPTTMTLSQEEEGLNSITPQSPTTTTTTPPKSSLQPPMMKNLNTTQRLKPLPKPALLDTSELLYKTVIGVVEPSNNKSSLLLQSSTWNNISYNDLKLISYELVLILSNSLIEYHTIHNNRQYIDTLLNVVRKYCGISKIDHFNMIKRVFSGISTTTGHNPLLSNNILSSFNTIDCVEYYQALTKLKSSHTESNVEQKSSLYLWKLIANNLKNSENLNVLKIYALVFLNVLLSLIFIKFHPSHTNTTTTATSITTSTNTNTTTTTLPFQIKLKNQIYSDFNSLQSCLCNEFELFIKCEEHPMENAIQIYTRLNSDIVMPLIPQLSENLINNGPLSIISTMTTTTSTTLTLPYPFPLNIKLYSQLSDTRVLNILKLLKNNQLEIPEYFEDIMNESNGVDYNEYFENVIEHDSVTMALKPIRQSLNISETMDTLCFIDSIFRMEQNCSTDTDLMLQCDQLLLLLFQYYIKKRNIISNYSKYSEEEKVYYDTIFGTMRQVLGHQLLDFTSSYSIDHEIFSCHLKLFRYICYIMMKNDSTLTNPSMNLIFENITKSSIRKQYERIKQQECTHVAWKGHVHTLEVTIASKNSGVIHSSNNSNNSSPTSPTSIHTPPIINSPTTTSIQSPTTSNSIHTPTKNNDLKDFFATDMDHEQDDTKDTTLIICNEFIQFGKELLSELTYQQSTLFASLSNYYEGAFIESLYMTFAFYMKDLQSILSKYLFPTTSTSTGTMNTGMNTNTTNTTSKNRDNAEFSSNHSHLFNIFSVLQSFLILFNECIFESNDVNEEENDIHDMNTTTTTTYKRSYPHRILKIFEPIMNLLKQPMTLYINHIQSQFFKYLENAVKLEKWQPLNEDVQYSSSYIDIFTFIRQGVPSLYSICLPNVLEYYKHFHQCLSGLMQRYCVHIMKDLPKPEDFIPKRLYPWSGGHVVDDTMTRRVNSSSTTTTSSSSRVNQKTGMFRKFLKSANSATSSATSTTTSSATSTTTTNSTRMDTTTITLGSSCLEAMNDLITDPRNQSFSNNDSNIITYESLFVRLANLVNTRRQYIKTVKELIEYSEQSRLLFIGKSNSTMEYNHQLPSIYASVDFYSNLEGTSDLLKDFISQLTELIGARNIYCELYNNLFGELYLPQVKDFTFAPKMIQEYFEPCLESLLDLCDDPVCVEWIITCMFKHLIRVLYLIIVEGYLSPYNEFHLKWRCLGGSGEGSSSSSSNNSKNSKKF
ncbi:hypothetical protein C9374_011868 [Naegleria lovaniensis]|uniref:MHD1 domain-containing protein n=1 Tax=Naegleria lovaniensis TaxID=51637 RepID=A0AA88GE90_NAELO|nr:uncharacterized protein C9374_011868 [Naegleria lovaniensis]KAG2373779.1 hypothetical protein C9374_011868 [Naegleria lovaniensis]